MMTDKEFQKKVNRPLLIMVRGLPGSGKSYVSTALAEELGTASVAIIDPDNLDTTDAKYREFSENLSLEGLATSIHPFRWLRKTACEAVIANKVVIWNQPFTIKGIFDRLILFIKDCASENNVNLSVLVVEVEIDSETAQRRIRERKESGGHGPSDGTFQRRVEEYSTFSESYQTVSIKGTVDINESVKKILAAVSNLGD